MRDPGYLPVFPAYAGVNPQLTPAASVNCRIPRVCGGEPEHPVKILYQWLYSPRMRG